MAFWLLRRTTWSADYGKTMGCLRPFPGVEGTLDSILEASGAAGNAAADRLAVNDGEARRRAEIPSGCCARIGR
jgi:hypothetical protein